jgi:hypothetical protein
LKEYLGYSAEKGSGSGANWFAEAGTLLSHRLDVHFVKAFVENCVPFQKFKLRLLKDDWARPYWPNTSLVKALDAGLTCAEIRKVRARKSRSHAIEFG